MKPSGSISENLQQLFKQGSLVQASSRGAVDFYPKLQQQLRQEGDDCLNELQALLLPFP